MVYGNQNIGLYGYGNQNVSFNGGISYSAQDIENLAKYATGVTLTNTSNFGMTEVLSSSASNLALSGGTWLWQNRKDLKGGMQAFTQAATDLSAIRQSAGIGGVFTSSAGSTLLKAIPTAEKLAKTTALSSTTVDLYNQARTLASEAAKTGSKEAMNQAHQLFAQANQAAYAEKTAAATGIGSKISNAIGLTKLNNGINALAVKSPTFGKCVNAFNAHGGGMMLLMEGGFEVVSNVVPTFSQLGAKAGMKQLGKSAVKTVASVGGWVAGAAVGTKVGALIGSVIPGAGTAVGAVVGAAIGSLCSLIGGSLGSRLAKKGAEKIVGKDELVLAQERQAQQLAQAAQTDSSVLNQVAGAAAERLEAEGTDSDDAKVAFQSLSNLRGRGASTQTSPAATNPFLAYTTTRTGFNTQQDLMAQTIGMGY